MAETTMPYGRPEFREVVRHPQAHAFVLGQYRLGEHAGVIALGRLLAEIEPEARLRRAMEIHHRDEGRHSRLFTDWMCRLGVTPPPLPDDVEAFFARSPEEFRERRALLAQLPAGVRRIFVFAAINAIERLAYAQFENHLLALDRAEDVANLESVVAEEKFHLSYVEAELDRQQHGEHAALESARERFAQFQALRQQETRHAIERFLAGGA
jgi:hypothetical protein